MKIAEEYFKTQTVHRMIPELTSRPNEGVLSCGLMVKNGVNCISKNINFPYYGGFYVLSGTGKHVDIASGKSYDIYPGCFVQRRPEMRHEEYIKNDGTWLEFYFCIGKSSYLTLQQIGIFPQAPVIYVGESWEIFQRCLHYLDQLSKASDQQLPYLLWEAEKLLYFIFTYQKVNAKSDSLENVCNLLNQNIQVGTSLTGLAKKYGWNYEVLRKKFKQNLGISLSQYLMLQRIGQSKIMLLDERKPVKQVASELGYTDEFAFSKQFKQLTGETPARFLRNFSS
ncbi:MAG: helix-turn-helix transcriptional regulator [Clostridia bacterium]